SSTACLKSVFTDLTGAPCHSTKCDTTMPRRTQARMCAKCAHCPCGRYAPTGCREPIGQPAWVDCILFWMNYVTRSEGKELGPIEYGFLHRLLQEDPGLPDRMLTTICQNYPQRS